MKNSVYVFLMGACLASTLFAQNIRDVKNVQATHGVVVQEFEKLPKIEVVQDSGRYQNVFNIAYGASSEYITLLRKDISVVKKAIKQRRKDHQSDSDLVDLKVKLENLNRFLRKYRLQFNVFVYHREVKKDWGTLFAIVDKGEDILPFLAEQGIVKTGLAGLKELVSKMERCLRKVSEYEDRLHSDWVDLKLANYVLKIELIRLRNAAIFHPLYRGTPIKSSYPR